MRLLRVGVAPLSCSANVLLTPPDEAVSVSVCVAVTAATLAVNAALVDPAETVTLDGMVTADPLLESETTRPLPDAALVKVTVQVSVPAAE